MQLALLVSHPGIVRDATLTMFPEIVLIGVASGALLATDLLQEMGINLLLLDANVPHDEGLALLRWTKEHKPEVRCVVMTTLQQDQALIRDADYVVNRAHLRTELEAILV